MPPTYYVIELSARWLTALLIALALALVMAFAFGYGAAWSVLSERTQASSPQPTEPEPDAVAEVVVRATPAVTPSVETPTVVATAAPGPAATATPSTAATARPQATATAPAATVTATPQATATRPPVAVVEPTPQGYWVQVLAVRHPDEVPDKRDRLESLGFPPSNQRLVQSQVAGGDTIYKLQIGPLPDRDSADRVVRRMQAAGFPDAWVVAP